MTFLSPTSTSSSHFCILLESPSDVRCKCLSGTHGHEQSGLLPYSLSGKETLHAYMPIYLLLLLMAVNEEILIRLTYVVSIDVHNGHIRTDA